MRDRRSDFPPSTGVSACIAACGDRAARAVVFAVAFIGAFAVAYTGAFTDGAAQAQSQLPSTALPPPGSAEQPLPEPLEPRRGDIFLRPEISAFEREIAILMQFGQIEEALAGLERLIQASPQVESLHFLKGLGLLSSGDREGSVAAFETAWAMGDRQLRELRESQPDIALFEDARIAVLLEAPEDEQEDGAENRTRRIPPPAKVLARTALVKAETTWWDPERRRLVARFEMPPGLDSLPVAAGDDETAQRLRALADEGKAAGLAGVLYDNRDRGHVSLSLRKFPQLVATAYDDDAQRAYVDYGLNTKILFERPVIGNSSTAVGGTAWRSQGRSALTQPFGAEQLALGYGANQIYFYPEHLDHDPVEANGLGDLFPANTPYAILTQGSSGSEVAAMEAVAAIVAALPPQTRAALEEKGLLAPAVQQIFRRGQAGIATEDDYLSPGAHPTVFDGARLEPGRMIDLAQGMTADAIPPMVRLEVVSESQNISPFGDGMNERFFTTPSAIARVHRTLKLTRAMTLNAAGTVDPNGRPLRFRWVLLRGDPEKVRIAPEGPNGERAAIEIDWHDRFRAGVGGIETQRVDIGVFAHNGAQWSAPAFVSTAFPPNERRVYDASGRLRELDHRAPGHRARYADPALFVDRDWTDRYLHNSNGSLTGWVRIRDRQRTMFTRHGMKVIETDDRDRPLIAEFVTYPVDRARENGPIVVERSSGRRARYRYASDDDRIGEPVLIRDADATE